MGTIVSIGAASGMAGMRVPLDLARVYAAGSVSMQILSVFRELEREPASAGLGRLTRLVAAGRLEPHIGGEAAWDEIGRMAGELVERSFPGKAVIHIRD